jgi:hypothetical protein
LSADERFEEWLRGSLRYGVPRAPDRLLDAVLAETAAAPQTKPIPAWRPPLLGATAAAAIAAVLLVMPLLFFRQALIGDASPSPLFSMAPNPTPQAAASGSARTETPGPAAFLSWERFDIPAADRYGGGARDIVRWGSSYVAVGGVIDYCCSDPPVFAVVWLSEDGEQWEILPRQPSLGLVTFQSIATDGQTLVATGAVWPDSPTGPNIIGEGALFRSIDGRTWERAAGAPDLGRLTVSAGRFVGVSSEDARPVAWVSDDGGSTWTDHHLPTALDDGLHVELNSLVGGPDGTLVAVGSIHGDPTEADSPTGTSWVSTDGGETWTWAAEAVPGFELRAAVRVGHRFFALGTPDDRMSSWIFSSDDGLSWSGQEIVRHSHPDVGWASWLLGTDDGLILIGHEMGQDGRLVPTLRTSRDGTSWMVVPTQSALDVRNLSFSEVLSTSEGILAIGSYWPIDGTREQPAAWRSSR